MDFATKDGRIYRRRLVARTHAGLQAAIANLIQRGYSECFAVDCGTHLAVYFDAR